jgi:imidazole glycerol-phosphate synthase subunit HisH
MTVVVVDSGGSNLGSVRYALERLGVRAHVSSEMGVIRHASHVILPGVGAADVAMERLHRYELNKVLRELKQPLLGVCLGMQLLFERSEEGDTECLGLLPGKAYRIEANETVRVPHIGWNALHIERDDPLLSGIAPDSDYAYFVHSYAVQPDQYTLAQTEHGRAFSAVIRCGNVCGMQFHPERSGFLGARLLANFLRL